MEIEYETGNFQGEKKDEVTSRPRGRNRKRLSKNKRSVETNTSAAPNVGGRSAARKKLRGEFQDRSRRQACADETLNKTIATQIRVLREQRKLTQKQLADLTGMTQPRIAVLEKSDYSSWSINTLRRLAEALDLRLSVKFETFSSLVKELEEFSPRTLERPSFADDPWFREDAEPYDGNRQSVFRDMAASERDEDLRADSVGQRVVSIADNMYHTSARRSASIEMALGRK